MIKLSIVIPCCQSMPNLLDLEEALLTLHGNLPEIHLQIVTVDDGSTDGTWDGLLEMSKKLPIEHIAVKLTGNFGSYNAFLAGLHYASGDYCVQLHADLQDPPEHIPEMLRIAKTGYKLIIGLRTKREDVEGNRWMSSLYHRMVKKIALPHIPEGGYDLILFDKSIRDTIVGMNESNINLVYLISSLKHPYVTIPITRLAREKGKSQWSLSKKRKLWIDTVVGFSYSPIRWLSTLAVASLPVNVLFLAFFWMNSSVGIEMKMAIVLILACLQLVIFGLAMVAEYLWRTLEASRKRPPFVVDQVITNNQ